LRKAALMKILFCAICCFSFSIGSQHDEISNQLLDFKKKIVTSYYYEEKFGSHVVSSKNEDLYKYDDEGNEIEIEKYLDNLIWYQEIKYFDYSNNLAKTIGYYLLSGDSSKTEFHYNEYNKLVEQIHYEFDGSVKQIEKLKYDNSDNLIDESHFDKNGNSIENVIGYHKSVSKYNEFNDIVEKTFYSISGIPDDENLFGFSKMITEYDSKHRIIGEKSILSNGNIISESTHTYNSSSNKIINTVQLGIDGQVISYTKFDYDPNGNILTSVTIDASKNNLDTPYSMYSFHITYQYDKSNRLSELNSFEYVTKFGELVKIPVSKITYEYIDF
jgi:hypothetical protein